MPKHVVSETESRSGDKFVERFIAEMKKVEQLKVPVLLNTSYWKFEHPRNKQRRWPLESTTIKLDVAILHHFSLQTRAFN